jgi:ComF family protein
LVFPDECRLCRQPLRNVSRIPVCPACLAKTRPIEAEFFCRQCRTPFVNAFPLDEHDLCTVCRESQANFDAAYSYGSYEGTLRDLIHLFKYARVESLSLPLSRLMAGALPRDERFDLVMAMPMHWLKRWLRGFNQAELLAKPIAQRLCLPLARNLNRKKLGKSQAGLDFAERMTNLEDAFYLRHPEQIPGRRILLVDDVMTTGATLRSAAGLLKDAGARRVCALALARAELRYPADLRTKTSATTTSAIPAWGSTTGAATTDEHSRGAMHARSGSTS